MGCQDGTLLRCSHGCLALFLEYVVRESKYCFTGAVSEITGRPPPPNCPVVGLEQETLMQAFPCYCTYTSFTQSRRPCYDLDSDSWKSLGWLKSLLHPHLQMQGPQTMVSVSLVSHLLSPLHQVLQVLGRQGLQYLLPGIQNNISAKPPEQLGFLLLVPLPLSNAFLLKELQPWLPGCRIESSLPALDVQCSMQCVQSLSTLSFLLQTIHSGLLVPTLNPLGAWHASSYL